jgi:diguanylate cyclase (GGDEF)-like protein/PAS domain S-box-containing protein
MIQKHQPPASEQPTSQNDQEAKTQQDLMAINRLLSQVEPSILAPVAEHADHQNRLVQVRLGLASSLFVALKIRHTPTAEHSLRVAMSCSAWALAAELSKEDHDAIEIAALLHDIGKIGVPDSILKSTGALTGEQRTVMQLTGQCSREILQALCKTDTIPDIVGQTGAWYDGSKPGFRWSGEEIPLLARMIAIVDAFDSMTTDQIYRQASPRDRAIAELFEFAGTQFDPRLVSQFAELQIHSHAKLGHYVSHRWLTDLVPATADELWKLNERVGELPAEQEGGNLFFERLWNSMHDGLFFVDSDACILNWNHGAERLTGLKRNSVRQRVWSTDIVRLRDLDGNRIHDDQCPIKYSLQSGTQYLCRVLIQSSDSGDTMVDLQVVPVIGVDGCRCGATVLIRDASSEALLEERVQTLHEKTILDPLTGVANRAEFDRGLSRSVRKHLKELHPCSLIICDIDNFKKVNDVHGHQAGDQALISFAALLQRTSRQGDLVGRYGGEEFVIICPHCGAAEATTLAEDIRSQLESLRLSELNNKSVTASFGVTELQPGDTAETMLRRADRGLLRAKNAGRNRVVQLGSGIDHTQTVTKDPWWAAWLTPSADQSILECAMETNVPLNLVADKLRGFVSDHDAEIVQVDEHQLIMRIDGWPSGRHGRQCDRPVRFVLHLEFSHPNAERKESRGTHVRAIVKPIRSRDRRHKPTDTARGLVSSLKAYLMAHEVTAKD